MTASVMLGTFALVPNLASYLQLNLGYPRDDLKWLYLAGGTMSFFATRLVGRWVDRYGSFRVGAVGTVWLVGVLYAGIVAPVRGVSSRTMAICLFLGFMLSNSLRGVPLNTLTSRVPAPSERARFMSIQSAVQHLASSLGATLAAPFLHQIPGGELEGMSAVASFSMACAVLFPFLAWAVEARVAPRVEPAPSHAA
jgi:predicted MFS family arabinose efflux permease